MSAVPARATTLITFDGTGYQDGSVQYSISGSTLTITLTNTATYAANAQLTPSDGLTGVVFKLPTGISLQANTAVIPSGSAIVQANKCDNASCAGVTDVGGEFGYQTAPFPTAGAPTGVNAGIGSSGQIAGNGTQFGGTDLDSPAEMDGINFGLVGSNYANAKPNGGLKNDPLIQSSVTFTLTIVGGTLLESQITNWSLVFGTAWGEGTVGGPGTGTPRDVGEVPEPSSLFLLGSGLTAAAAAIRRRRTRAAKTA